MTTNLIKLEVDMQAKLTSYIQMDVTWLTTMILEILWFPQDSLVLLQFRQIGLFSRLQHILAENLDDLKVNNTEDRHIVTIVTVTAEPDSREGGSKCMRVRHTVWVHWA